MLRWLNVRVGFMDIKPKVRYVYVKVVHGLLNTRPYMSHLRGQN